MRYLRIISACLLLLILLAACQPAESTLSVPEDPELQTATPSLIPESTQAQPSNPLLTPEDVDMPPPMTPDAAAQKMVDLVKENLTQRLGMPVEQIILVEVRQTVWRDAGLGCPKPAVDYIPLETPGYKIVLEVGGQIYNYHTDQVKRFVICNRQ